MRNRKFVVGALACTMALGVYGIAQADETTQTQTMYGKAAPTKVPKKPRQGLKSFDVGVETLDSAPNGRLGTNQPYPSTSTILDFDNDILFTIKSVPYAQVSKNNSLGQCTTPLEGKSATEAKQNSVCGKAFVGEGDAEANLLGTLIPATVTAFNGAPENGKPVILLHSDPGFDQFVLSGVLRKSNYGSDYGQQLFIADIPALSGGAAITNFHTDVGGVTYKRKGSKYSYVSAKCADGNKTWNFHGKFFFDKDYNDSAPEFSLDANATQTCKVKPKPKRKRK